MIAGIDRETPLPTVFRGAMWFVAMEFVTITLLFLFPVLITWLPSLMDRG